GDRADAEHRAVGVDRFALADVRPAIPLRQEQLAVTNHGDRGTGDVLVAHVRDHHAVEERFQLRGVRWPASGRYVQLRRLRTQRRCREEYRQTQCLQPCRMPRTSHRIPPLWIWTSQELRPTVTAR